MHEEGTISVNVLVSAGFPAWVQIPGFPRTDHAIAERVCANALFQRFCNGNMTSGLYKCCNVIVIQGTGKLESTRMIDQQLSGPTTSSPFQDLLARDRSPTRAKMDFLGKP